MSILTTVREKMTAAQPQRYRWWHATAFGLVVNAISGVSVGRRAQDREYYANMRQAPFAPPGWVFGPVWALNNVSVLYGNLRLLNMREDTPRRRSLLWLQGASWMLYSTFSYVYFRKRSVVLAFVWTASMFVLTLASMLLAWQTDRKMAGSLVTLLLWLTLATPVAAYQMLYNPDEFFYTPALREIVQ